MNQGNVLPILVQLFFFQQGTKVCLFFSWGVPKQCSPHSEPQLFFLHHRGDDRHLSPVLESGKKKTKFTVHPAVKTEIKLTEV